MGSCSTYFTSFLKKTKHFIPCQKGKKKSPLKSRMLQCYKLKLFCLQKNLDIFWSPNKQPNKPKTMRNKNFTIFEKKYIFDLYVDTNTNFDIPEKKRKKTFCCWNFFLVFVLVEKKQALLGFSFLRHCFTAGSEFEKFWATSVKIKIK
jgi:hypothetical protein